MEQGLYLPNISSDQARMIGYHDKFAAFDFSHQDGFPVNLVLKEPELHPTSHPKESAC